jgi:hypothetical protein
MKHKSTLTVGAVQPERKYVFDSIVYESECGSLFEMTSRIIEQIKKIYLSALPRSRHRHRQRVQFAEFEAQKRPPTVKVGCLGAAVGDEIAKESKRDDDVGGGRAVATAKVGMCRCIAQ